MFDKIEEIRHQPEHIRLRWVWGFTIGAMVVIILIWMISFSAQKNETSSENLSNQELIQELSGQKEELQSAAGQVKSSLSVPVQNNSSN